MKPATYVLRLWQRPDGLRLELINSQGEREVFRDFEALAARLKEVAIVKPPVVVLGASAKGSSL